MSLYYHISFAGYMVILFLLRNSGHETGKYDFLDFPVFCFQVNEILI